MRSTFFLILIGSAACAQSPPNASLKITPDTVTSRLTRPAAEFKKLEQEIRDMVGREFYDSKRAAQWVKKQQNYAANITDQTMFAWRTNQALAELKTSHTAYYTPLDLDYYALLAIFQQALGIAEVQYDSIGVNFVKLPQGYFVQQVRPGSSTQRLDLMRGDQLLSNADQPVDPIQAFHDTTGQGVVVQVMRKRGGFPLIVGQIPVIRINPKMDWLNAQKQGTRIIRRNRRNILYIPLFSGAGDEFREAVQDSLIEHQNADALILDFRDGYGGLSPDFMNLFNPLTPVLSSTGRNGKPQTIRFAWRKPLFVLINRGTRSGKEVIAYTIKKRRIGTLIGERTAGAVVGGRVFLLSDKSLLYLAVQDVRVDGVRLEGKGVEPDIKVADRLPYAMGADPQLEKALALASKRKK